MSLINEGGKLLLRNGKLAFGQACCCGECQCANGVYTGKTLTASVTITLPEVEGDCPGGEFSVEFTLSYSSLYGYYWTSHLFEIGQQTFFDYETEQEMSYSVNGSAVAYLLCDGTQYLSGVQFSGVNCTLGNGNFFGVGPDPEDLAVHPSVTFGGSCVPGNGSGDYTEPSTGVRVQWTITVT